MTLSAPIQFDQHDQDAGHDREPDVTPATATLPAEAAAQPQQQGAAHLTATTEQQASTSSWGVIVLATLALWGGLGLWTMIAVSGGYVRWVLSVVVLGVIMVMSLVALKRVVADK